jgi:protein phosphatase
MGGHKGGETASALAVDFIVQKVKEGEPLTNSIAAAHHVIKEASENGKGPEGMGTTVVALKATDSQYEIAWVGDCRAYLWDGEQLAQLTKDHSYVQHLVDTGVLLPSETSHHPYQDVLLQALGAKEINDVNVGVLTHEWHHKEQILLCSDGLTKELEHKDIARILSLDASEQAKVDLLIQTALEKGGKDNITAILVSAHENAPVKTPEQDTQPLQTGKLNWKKKGVAENIFSWLKKHIQNIKSH